MGQKTDAVTLLLNDHDEVRQLFGRFDTATTPEQKKEIFQQLVHELAVHETAEEEIVYPMLRKDVADGDGIADKRIAEEEQADKLLASMEKMDPSSSEFTAAFGKLRTAVLSHAEREEQEVFPRLRSHEDGERLASMGRLLEMAKKTAPTRPHPHVPGSATANLVAGPMAAIVDRTRDAIRDARQRLAG